MNTVSMNNLWNYLKGPSLSAQNRHWLAERLLESSVEPKRNSTADTVITENDLMVSPEVAALVKGFELPEAFNAEQAKMNYLMEKYK